MKTRDVNKKAYLSAQPFPECSCSFSVPLHSAKAVGTWRSAPAAEMVDINLRGQTKRLCVPALLTDCFIPLSSALAKTKGSEMGRSPPYTCTLANVCFSSVVVLKFRTKAGNHSFKRTLKQSDRFTVTVCAHYMYAINWTRVGFQHQVHFQKLGQPRADSECRVVFYKGMTGM